MAVGAILFIVILEVVLHFDVLDSILWSLYGPYYFLTGIVGTLYYLAIIIPISVSVGFAVGWARLWRLRVPPLANELAVVIKDTSFLAIIGSLDLFGLSNIFSQQSVFGSNHLWWLFVVWTAVALVYFVMTFTVTELLNWIDRRYHVKGLEAISV